MAHGVVRRHGRTSEQDYRNVLQARGGFYDGAQIVAGDFIAFSFSHDDVRRLGLNDIQSLPSFSTVTTW